LSGGFFDIAAALEVHHDGDAEALAESNNLGVV
jgi:hypothetical protein